jgi:signal transduction histidine kinase
MIRGPLVTEHRAIDGMISQFLVLNNQVQEEAARANRDIYDRVGREILLLVGGLLLVTGLAGAWFVSSNRRAFEEVADVSEQLRTLSWRTLRVQEDVQRSISRELHDDFGQIVTAIGTLLGRVRRQIGPGSPLATELDHVRGIAQQALDRIRTQSQWLHPGLLDDFGLERALQVCVEQFERQSGIKTTLSVQGPVQAIKDGRAIHVYRIAQEALSNIGRHSGSTEAWVRLTSHDECLDLEIEDRGKGLPPDEAVRRSERGLGLVSMRERAELIGGELWVRQADAGGVRVQLRVPAWTVAAPPARNEVA